MAPGDQVGWVSWPGDGGVRGGGDGRGCCSALEVDIEVRRSLLLSRCACLSAPPRDRDLDHTAAPLLLLLG
eukprot:COSAG01_NODE_766_length_13741_cov_16.630479_3_plen_71_part_00